YILCGRVTAAADQPEWVQNLRAARLSFINQQVSAADQYLLKAIGTASDNVLTAILHLQITRATADTQAVQNLAGLYSQRWPECVLFSLYLAEAQMELGSEVLAVNVLHECAARDAAGMVPARVWGKEHPYKSLWPEINDFEFALSIPAQVAAAMGWNQLGSGVSQQSTQPAKPEATKPIKPQGVTQEKPQGASINPGQNISVNNPQNTVKEFSQNIAQVLTSKTSSIFAAAQKAVTSIIQSENEPEPVVKVPVTRVREELAKVALKLDQVGIASADHRFPIFVILSIRSGLEKQYGKQTFAVIDSELRNLAISTGRLPEWDARVIYVDDLDSTGKAGLTPIEAIDPWKIKLLLTDMDNLLAKKGEMIGSLLLVGGPEVIPFHRLPNPTDDLDDEVLSDSPYSTRDSNYFVPEWPVSRLPGGKGPDSGLLLEQIRRVAQSVTQKNQTGRFNLRLPDLPIFSLLQEFFNQNQIFGNSATFGYSAEIWKRSSEEVYSQVSKTKSILSSPPLNSDSIQGPQAVSAAVSYFNLHGVVDSAEWYGQRDMAITPQGPDYPVAIKPDDLFRSGPDNGIVYSEACYGGHISNKDEEESIALKFLSTGSASVIGSTCTSYGSVTTPLIGADLLGFYFLKNINAGQATGEALYHARIEFIQEMQKRQGYLDGEDQKTLISFVMYGNPFATLRTSNKRSKTIHRAKMAAEVHAVCTKDHQMELPKRMGDETMAKIKQAVEPYLPGLANAQVYYSRVHTECSGKNHVCPTSEIHTQSKSHARSGKMVVSISKMVTSANRNHSHFARVTIDGKGKMVKLTVSR
ncbi:MAG: C25 family cysteine peptidase, partial [Leptolinea sp.]